MYSGYITQYVVHAFNHYKSWLLRVGPLNVELR